MPAPGRSPLPSPREASLDRGHGRHLPVTLWVIAGPVAGVWAQRCSEGIWGTSRPMTNGFFLCLSHHLTTSTKVREQKSHSPFTAPVAGMQEIILVKCPHWHSLKGHPVLVLYGWPARAGTLPTWRAFMRGLARVPHTLDAFTASENLFWVSPLWRRSRVQRPGAQR